ncbi:hypothetical protein [Streptomyces sp. NPDC007904]|jgi:hypothetical protein|uniref:hypothetical protein n=1 Tax=Streptomyces sp. NPDC007904 TaxID=3364787 RepID=UPI0036EBB3AC
MSTERSQAGRRARPVPGALLLCRAEAGSVAPAAGPLHERMLLAGAGEEWSVLVPEGTPWADGAEPVDRVVTGWATALTVGASWPVVALWWDADRAGFTLASGFRRPVDYVWLADGTPAGQDEAMRTFAGRLGLDPVLDLPTLDLLTEADPAADATARLRGVLAVLTRAGVVPPPGLVPGESAAGLLAAARMLPDARNVEEPEPERTRAPREAGAVSGGGPAAWPPGPGTSAARTLALVQLAAGLPLALWGLRHRSGGWITAGTLLLAHGTLGLAAHTRTRPG